MRAGRYYAMIMIIEVAVLIPQVHSIQEIVGVSQSTGKMGNCGAVTKKRINRNNVC